MLRKLDQKGDELGTMPRLKHLLLQPVCDWSSHTTSAANEFTMSRPDAPIGIRRLVYQQNAIGWDHLFLGRFSSK